MKEKKLPSLFISSVTISFFIHATEDQSRVMERISKILGVAENEMEWESLSGYYGNAIIYAKAHLTGDQAAETFKQILNKLDCSSKKKLISELGTYVDEHDSLYLRVDKEILMDLGQEKELALGEDEAIRIKIKPKNRWGGQKALLDSYKRVIEE